MYDHIIKELSRIEGWIITRSNDMAWPLGAIPQILEIASSNQWIVLGGDVVTPSGKYTYDSWFYDPIWRDSLEVNVSQSVSSCLEYVSNYVKENGEAFYFTFSISDTHVGAVY